MTTQQSRYAPSPRPTFDGPAHIPYTAVTRHLWGDEESGEVSDWIYVSSDKIHQLVFGLPPGGAFRHSDAYRTIFGADEVFFVLSGIMMIANPANGEVHRVAAGEGVFFGPDTWHHVFNDGIEPLRVLEYFAPPPSQGTSGVYARSKPNLTKATYSRDHLLGRWPAARAESAQEQTLHVLREADVLWRLEGCTQHTPVGLLATTEHITVGKMHLLPSRHTDVEIHRGDEALYLLDGLLQVRLPANDGQRWFELAPADGFYIPEGVPHQYYNMSGQPATLLCGVAPSYQAMKG